MAGCACAFQPIAFTRAAIALVLWPMPVSTGAFPHVSSPIRSFKPLHPSRVRRDVSFSATTRFAQLHLPPGQFTGGHSVSTASCVYANTILPFFSLPSLTPFLITLFGVMRRSLAIFKPLPTSHSYICHLGSSLALPRSSNLQRAR